MAFFYSECSLLRASIHTFTQCFVLRFFLIIMPTHFINMQLGGAKVI